MEMARLRKIHFFMLSWFNKLFLAYPSHSLPCLFYLMLSTLALLSPSLVWLFLALSYLTLPLHGIAPPCPSLAPSLPYPFLLCLPLALPYFDLLLDVGLGFSVNFFPLLSGRPWNGEEAAFRIVSDKDTKGSG